MPSFDLLHKVEYYLRTGKHHPESSSISKKVTHGASKKFILIDGCLFRKYRERLLRAVMSDEEVRELMIRYHDNNSHAGRLKMVKEIMSMYYWVGVTDVVKAWVKACEVCKLRKVPEQPPIVRFCLAYGCDASSFLYPELCFYKFPKQPDRRRRWLNVAQRDECSLRQGSYLCSRHFDSSCYTLTEEGVMSLSPDAVPTIIGVSKRDAQVPVSDETFLHSTCLEDLLSSAAASAEVCDLGSEQTDPQLQEHQYSLPVPDPRETPTQLNDQRQRPTFATYNLIARYLSHRILPQQSKKNKNALRRMSKRFGLIDGVLMYTRVSPPVQVPRSREEVNSILQQFHDNSDHYGHGTCYKAMARHYYWGTMSRDLNQWISRCSTCAKRSKRKWLRCSIVNCTNCCGPVERGLGLTFYNFPMDNPPLLSRWLKAVGRPHWYPHLWSSVCSVHFTEDCFDRSGDKVVLRPDAVPTLKAHGDQATRCDNEVQSATVTDETSGQEEAFFAKYDAVELYISRRTYPPGLNYVEKNTFRRFCKKYFMKDGQLHIRIGDHLRLVLRNRQQVNDALKDYHDELNHLDLNKCLRLLNEKYFWKTMRSDIQQWIGKCLVCRSKQKKKNTKKEPAQRQETLQQHRAHNDEEEGAEDWGEGSDFSEAEPETTVNYPEPQTSVQASKPPQQIPILLHLRTPINLKAQTPIILKSSTDSTMVAQLWSPKDAPKKLKKKNTAAVPTETQNRFKTEIQIENQHELNYQHEEQVETSGSKKSSRHIIRIQKVNISHTKIVEASASQASLSQTPIPRSSRGRPLKRKGPPDEQSPSKKVQSPGLEPAPDPGSKPVFTVERSQPDKQSPVKGAGARQSLPTLEARVVVQQCSRAKVKVKPALDEADAQWSEIAEGIVVYVCFFEGATEDVTQKIADSVTSTRFFRQDRRLMSVLDLPGSVLLLPQESLGAEPGPRRAMTQSRGASEAWWGAQLFSALVSRCRDLMSRSEKCLRARTAVEHGVYGQRQEIELSSLEPMSHVLEF